MFPDYIRVLFTDAAAPGVEAAMPWLLVALGVGYLFGSIPFGLVIARLLGLGDLRKIGSGNIGTTNMLRTGNKWAALATLLLDSGKGAVAVLAFSSWGMATGVPTVAGFGAVLGHIFPIWLGFKGGKGVATFLGLNLALGPIAGVAICLTWLATALVFRMSSLSALVATASAPLWLYLTGNIEDVFLVAVLAVLVWVRHIENISRILKGTESRINFKKKK